MILVSLGTQDKSFVRLLKLVEDAIVEGYIDEEVVVQAGYTTYQSNKMKIFDYISMDEFENLLSECSLLITHGGVGTIMNALKQKKTILACARLEKYHEHHNDHQKEIVSSFDELGYLIEVEEDKKLKDYLEQAKTFIPKEFESNTKNMINTLMEIIGENE